jgi:hypothetical protein
MMVVLRWLCRRIGVIAFCSFAVGTSIGCSAADPPRDEHVSDVEEEFSTVGSERLVPIRWIFLQSTAGSIPNSTLELMQARLNEANHVFRQAGVQFYTSAIQKNVTPMLSNVSVLPNGASIKTWSQVGSELRSVFTNMPTNAYLAGDSAELETWLFIASSKYGQVDELVIFMPEVATSSAGMFPWLGNGVRMTVNALLHPTNLSHEIGHYLGLVHTFDNPPSSPDPRTGGTHTIDDFWDLVYGMGDPLGAAGPVYFTSKAQSQSYTGWKRAKNAFWGTPSDNCQEVVGGACQYECALQLVSSQGYSQIAVATGSTALEGGMTFTQAGESGVNVMAYIPYTNNGCFSNGISRSQTVMVRKYLRYDMTQAANGTYIGTPQNTQRHRLGVRRAEPVSWLDFDGDLKRDIGVYSPPITNSGTGTFSIRLSSQGYSSAGALIRSFGKLGDIPVPSDYDGDGKTDIAVYRTDQDPQINMAFWLYCLSTLNHDCVSPGSVQFGSRTDVPLVGTNFDGLSTNEMALFRRGTGVFYWRYAPYNTTNSKTMSVADAGVTPLVGGFDSDHKTDLVTYHPSNRKFRYRMSGGSWNTEVVRTFSAPAGSYPVRLQKNNREVLALYDFNINGFQIMWDFQTSSAVTAALPGLVTDYGVASSLGIDRDADARTDFLVVADTPDLLSQWTIYGSAAGTPWPAPAGAPTLEGATVFTAQDASGDGKFDLYVLKANGLLGASAWRWTFFRSETGFSTWSHVFLGSPGDIPL